MSEFCPGCGDTHGEEQLTSSPILAEEFRIAMRSFHEVEGKIPDEYLQGLASGVMLMACQSDPLCKVMLMTAPELVAGIIQGMILEMRKIREAILREE